MVERQSSVTGIERNDEPRSQCTMWMCSQPVADLTAHLTRRNTCDYHMCTIIVHNKLVCASDQLVGRTRS
jgi:hypothetical protein